MSTEAIVVKMGFDAADYDLNMFVSNIHSAALIATNIQIVSAIVNAILVFFEIIKNI